MRRLNFKNNSADIQVSLDGLVILNNALNEICYGIDMDDAEFSVRIGAEHKDGVCLLNEISSLIGELEKECEEESLLETFASLLQRFDPSLLKKLSSSSDSYNNPITVNY